jgi:hypothetical protein
MTRLWLVCWFFLAAVDVGAQERGRVFPPDIFDTRPTALDPAHYLLILENDHVKVIRVRLGPHEKSMVMELPAHVMTCITDQHVRVIHPRGKPAERSQKAGYTGWLDRDEYGLENLADQPAEWILVIPSGAEKSG